MTSRPYDDSQRKLRSPPGGSGQNSKVPLGARVPDGYDFAWLIVNEDNLVKYLRGERFRAEKEGSDEGIYKLLWDVREKAPWTLVLETRGTQITREVEVHLRLEDA